MVNNQGFRDSRPTDVHKALGCYRVICIGDSVTFGVPVKLNQPTDTFPKQLEDLLRTRLNTKQIEVLNAGVPGYTSYQSLQQMKHRLVRYNPDLVVVQFGINDAGGAKGYPDKEQQMPLGIVAHAHNILGRSALYYTLRRFLAPANNQSWKSK